MTALEREMEALKEDVQGQDRDNPGVLTRVDRIERDLDRLMTGSKWLFGTVAALVIAEIIRFIVSFKLGSGAV